MSEQDPILDRLHNTFGQATESIQSHPTPQWIDKVMELLEDSMRQLLADVAIEEATMMHRYYDWHPERTIPQCIKRIRARFGVKEEGR